jgi:hypothetical protein
MSGAAAVLDPPSAPDYGDETMVLPRGRARSLLTLVIGLAAVALPAGAATTLDFVTFDGIDYIRWLEEPGRALTSSDLGIEFGSIQCSLGEDVRGCPYGIDGGAAFLPAGTRVHVVRGHPTEFRLAAVWRDRIFLYQAWRNPRAKVGADLYAIAGKVRAVDVERTEPTPGAPRSGVTITAPAEVQALADMVVRARVQRPQAHAFGELRYWLTFWLTDGTTLTRPFFVETSELMGGVVVPGEFRAVLQRHLVD